MSIDAISRRLAARWMLLALATAIPLAGGLRPSAARAQDQLVEPLAGKAIVHNVTDPNERLEMIVNSSRILTLDKKIPQAQVNNREVLEVTPLSPTQIQIFAKAPGVTQVNLWDEEKNVHTIDVIVFGDAQELSLLLRSQFPTASLRVIPLANSVVISGHVDNPDQVARIIEIAEDFHPKVINNISVSGVQQVMLKVKVMEVSRTNLRALGVDLTNFNGDDFVASGISGLVSGAGNSTATGIGGALATLGTATGTVSTQSGTMMFGVVDGTNAFFGFLSALHERNLLKILAEPDLVTVSGRPASFIVGGEFPILVPQSLGTVSIEFKKFGTQVDFVPIVLGNRRVRLEVRPRVSEIDETRSVQIGDIDVPGLRLREVNTGVEMRAGQTLALAGLVQNRIDAESRGLPILGDLPVVGVMFKRVRERENEIELLILVTPQFVEGMDAEEVPPGGPGLFSCSPNDCQLYLKGHLEVPCCNDGTCGQCPQCTGPGTGSYGGGYYGGSYQLSPEGVPATPLDQPYIDEPEVIVPSHPLPVEPVPDVTPERTDAASAQPELRGPNVSPRRGVRLEASLERVPQTESSRRPNRHQPAVLNTSTEPQNQNARKAPPGIIGPVGYDVDN